MTVQWRGDESITVGGHADLDAVLDAIERDTPPDRPVLVSVIHPMGNCLTIGLGGSLSVLTSVPADGNPPYFTSLGDVARGEPGAEESVVFFYHDHWSEFSRYQCLVPAIARKAMRDFFQTGELPQWLHWEEE